jgi:hypothetical protein
VDADDQQIWIQKCRYSFLTHRKAFKWCLPPRQENKWFCRYRRQWQFEKMWIGKSHKTLLAYICLLFCKLDLSIAVQQILCTLIKRSSFQKSVVSKFTPKLTLSLPTVL